jgi:23S rRNA pseudouridine2605 synthase
MSEERIQKILARAGVSSRRKAEELIQQGLVTVNGRIAELGDKADPEHDAIKVEGKRLQPHHGEHHYLLLNKPKEVMSTLSDPQRRPTVLEYVPPALRKALVPVGRLDFHTEGLLLLTDDGDFAQRIAHPRYGGVKTYEVKVKGKPEEKQLDRLRNGIEIDGRRTAPCKITPRPSPVARRRNRRDDEERGENTWWIVELTEGRTRQIREMFIRIGHPVQKLRRVGIGPLRDPDLPVGAVRELTPREVSRLLEGARDPKEKKAAKAAAKAGVKTAAKPAAKKPAAKKPRKSAPRTLAEVAREAAGVRKRTLKVRKPAPAPRRG